MRQGPSRPPHLSPPANSNQSKFSLLRHIPKNQLLVFSHDRHLAAVVLAQSVKTFELVDIILIIICGGNRERGGCGSRARGGLVAGVGKHILFLLLLARLAEDFGAEGGRNGGLLIRLVLLGGAGAAALRGVGNRVGVGTQREAVLRLFLGAGLSLLPRHGFADSGLG
jgi:hypothetical protein